MLQQAAGYIYTSKSRKMSKEQVKKEEDPKSELIGNMDECGERSEYHNLVDILFVLDATGSMSWCMDQMKKTVCKIMKKFTDKQYNIKFAIELYRDHEPQDYTYVEKHFDLRNMNEIIKVIDKECDVGGGGDTPEAVFDGLVNGLKKTSWRISTDGKTKSKRFLFHGCDAPPHGKQYGCTSSDSKWTEKGCPCGLTRHDVKKLLNEHNVDYSLIKCGSQADTMATLFKQCFAEKFKRQLEIKQSSSYYGGSRKRGRRTSQVYMKEIQRQQCLSDYSGEYECQEAIQAPYKLEKCEAEKSPSLISSIKKFFGSKQKSAMKGPPMKMAMKSSAPRKKAPMKLKKKQMEKKENCEQDNDSDSSDSENGSRPRSMASLVLSDIQDGIESYFEEPEKQKK